MALTDKGLLRYLFLGFVRIHVLHHACQEEIYGAGIKQELARHGYDLSPGTLYPLLQDMEARGFLARKNKVVEGRVRKYYRCTGEGRRALALGQAQIRELVGEVL